MPLYDWSCPRDGVKKELLMSYDRAQVVEVLCPQCQNAMVRLVSMPAKTASAWHSNWSEGMEHNYFSHALGRKVANKREEEKILNARGFVSENDLGKDWFDRKQAERQEKRDAQDKKSELYNQTLKETGDAAKAVEVAFPAHECLNGTLDKLYDEKITI